MIPVARYIAVALWLLGLPAGAAAGVGQALLAGLPAGADRPGVGCYYIWPEIEVRGRSAPAADQEREQLFKSIQAELGARRLFKKNSRAIDQLRRNHDDLLAGGLTPAGIDQFRAEAIDLLIHGYVYQVPADVLAWGRPVDVLVLKVIDIDAGQTAGLTVFDRRTLAPLPIVPEPRAGLFAADTFTPRFLTCAACPDADSDLGRFLVDLFFDLQARGSAPAQRRRFDDRGIWQQPRACRADAAGQIQLLRFGPEQAAYLWVECGGSAQTRVPNNLVRICGDTDVQLLAVMAELTRQLKSAPAARALGPQTPLRVQVKTRSAWPYSTDQLRQILRYCVIANGLGQPVAAKAHHRLVLRNFSLARYVTAGGAWNPEYHYSARLTTARAETLLTLPGVAQPPGATRLNSQTMFMAHVKNRAKELIQAGRHQEAERLIADIAADGHVKAELERMLCAAAFDITFARELARIHSLTINNQITDARRAKNALIRELQRTPCLSAAEKQQMRSELELSQ